LNYKILFAIFFSAILLTPAISQNAFGYTNSLSWNENKKLTWDDFHGFINYGSPFFAEAYTDVSWEYSWEYSNLNDCYYEYSKISATASFDKGKSFVKPGRESDSLLNHEQGHFDIAEISAKEFNERIHKELMGKYFPCPEGIDASDTISNQAKNRAQQIFDQENQKGTDMQRDYDTDTFHGKYNDKQIEWDEKIQSLLGIEREFESHRVESESSTSMAPESPGPGESGCISQGICFTNFVDLGKTITRPLLDLVSNIVSNFFSIL